MANAFLLEPAVLEQIASPSVAAGYAVTNLGNDYAGVVWRSDRNTNLPSFFFQVPAGQVVDAVMLFGILGASAITRMTIRSSFAPVFDQSVVLYDGPLLAGSAATSNGFGCAMAKLPATAQQYWWVIFYEAAGGISADLSVSRIVAGKQITFDRNFSFGGSFGVRDLGSLDFSRRGVLSRARGAKLRTVGLTFSHVRKDEVELATKPLLERTGNTGMIALCTDPVEHPQRQNRCYYGPLVGDIGQIWRNAAAFEAKINLVSIF